MAKTTFNEKLNDSRDMPKVVDITDTKMIARFGGTTMLVAPPLAYDEIL